jgi:hypothetical protein
VRAKTKLEAERAGKCMIRPRFSLERLFFLMSRPLTSLHGRR